MRAFDCLFLIESILPMERFGRMAYIYLSIHKKLSFNSPQLPKCINFVYEL